MNADILHREDNLAAPRLTVETAAYFAIAALALGLRLAALGWYPLTGGEASQALSAWNAIQGQPLTAVAYSPLTFSLSLPLFLLFGASDFSARLAPALLGCALVLLPYFLRHRLGRGGALIASALLAWSPSTLYLSRIAGGGMGAAFGALLATTGFVRWLDYREEKWLYLGAGGLALALISDGNGYLFLLLAATFIWALYLFDPQSPEGALRTALSDLLSTPGPGGRAAAVFVLTFLAGATAFSFHPNSLARAAELLPEWLASFRLAGEGAISPPLFLLVLYEPLALVMGLACLGLLAFRRDGLTMFLAYWFFGAAMIVTFQQGRTAGAFPMITIPLILLSADSLDKLLRQPRERQEWMTEALLVAVFLAISAYGYIELGGYARNGETDRLLMVAIAFGLCVGVFALFWVWYGMACTLRGGTLALAMLLALSSFSAGQRLAYDIRTLPYEPAATNPTTSANLRDALKTLSDASGHRTGDVQALDVTVEETGGPILRWYLRGFGNAHFVADVGSSPASQALITADKPDLGSSEAYAGQSFTLREAGDVQKSNAVELVRWLLFRKSAQPPQQEKLVLWLKQQ